MIHSSRTTTLSSKSDGVVLSGYQKKLKTMKKKYFVIYKDTCKNLARLEYYDSEKKFKQGLDPKRVIKLKNCFNINRRLDTKHEFVLSLSTKEGGFGIVLDSENDMRKWMEVLVSLQRNTANSSESSYPSFDHVWQVNIQKKGIAEEKGIVGKYHVCLSSKKLTFISIGPERNLYVPNRTVTVEFLLTTIRRCGDSQCFFYMEVGRQSSIGPGELWMETEDALTAQNMHQMILSAMSAKNESNLNSVNLNQGKFELITEPMRKRSSSANEASKPVNVMQKRQLPIEIKTNISPQNFLQTCGRERCDSLPSRNRTASECNDQSFASGVHTFRSNTISGLRPYSYQRHSNSPPMNTSVVCSESEESSISIDEPDDSATFTHYRFNSRTSEGVIPEENADDINIADIKCSVYNPCSGRQQDDYTTMTPVSTFIDYIDQNKVNEFIPTHDPDESKRICSLNVFNKVPSGLNCDFPEHFSEKLSKTSETDNDQQCELPVRAYSIGSKIEHNRINKFIGNVHESEQNSTRVRAFSVGSRAKIPRCDLQRGVLTSKSHNDAKVNSSNNNILLLTDLPTCNEISLTTPDKKSTSAPLLTHKSQSNVDRMSDLMELDFSKISNNSHKRNHSVFKLNLSKPITANKNHTKRNEVFLGHESYINNIGTKKPFYADNNGYLEMKPIGTLMSPSNSVINQSKVFIKESSSESISKPKIGEQLHSVSREVDFRNKFMNDNIGSNKHSARFYKNELRVNSDCKSVETDDKNVVNPTDICSSEDLISRNFYKLNVSNSNNTDLNEENKKELETFCLLNTNAITNSKNQVNCEKIFHSVGNELYINDNSKMEKEMEKTDEGGYKIIQIKSDSSLQSSKKIYRPFNCKDRSKQQKNSLKGEHKNLNEKSTNIVLSKDTDSVLTSSTLLDILSRPPSVASEHELHYVSLDLPQSSPLNNIKTPKKEIKQDSSSLPVNVHMSNSYAKIDFDHSDSSSCSSKVLNI